MVVLTDNLTITMHPNVNKTNDLHPDLTGSFHLEGKSYELANWIRTTLDRQRQYHSILVYDSVARKAAFRSKTKCEPGAKLKLYETRKRVPQDPDFFTTEPFSLAGIVWYAAMWVSFNSDPNELDAMSFKLVFSRQPFRQAATPEAINSLSEFRDRLQEREKERLQEELRLVTEQREQAEFQARRAALEARHQAAEGDDDIDMSLPQKPGPTDQAGDPIDLPF
jgi:hypothetical protein